jgi:hypothetical protein
MLRKWIRADEIALLAERRLTLTVGQISRPGAG